jgi:Sulfotransferase family
MASRSFSFVFVCHAGELEIPSLLLAGSLLRHAQGHHELVAAIPTPSSQWPAPPGHVLDTLGQMGVRIASIRNPISPDYPIGNKIGALEIATTTDRTVLLDSDIVCLSDFEDCPVFGAPFAAKPADEVSFPGPPDAWGKLYSLFELSLPTTRVRTTSSGQYLPPYFNSGVIAVDSKVNLGQAWIEVCRKLATANLGFPVGRWLDQVGLPIAVRKLQLSPRSLGERYNFPLHRKTLDLRDLPVLCHYHRPEFARREPIIAEEVQAICDLCPPIRDAIERHEKWKPMLARRIHPTGRAMQEPLPELVITGVPRSGTSYLCNVLHRFGNCVVVNEPDSVNLLLQQPTAWGAAMMVRDVRRCVLEGVPIRNKLADGKVVEDTTQSHQASEYLPSVQNDQFVLGIKNTVSALTRLDDLCEAMPHARFVACVRNPFDTIASWKKSFAHLRDVDLKAIPVGRVDDPWLTPQQRHELLAIDAITSPATRRAAYWNYLAMQVLRRQGDLIVVRYTDLVLYPQEVIERITMGWDMGTPTPAIESSAVRSSRSELDAADIEAIEAICLATAESLGVLS